MMTAGSHLIAAEANETQVKSAFIIKVIKFISWSETNPTAIRQVCVYPKNPFKKSLETYAKLSSSKARQKIKINYPEKLTELSSCDVLFLSQKVAVDLEKINDIAQRNSILTISDIDDFASNKGMIEVDLKNKKIELHINLNSSRAAELTMSSKLLGLAVEVIKDNGDKR